MRLAEPVADFIRPSAFSGVGFGEAVTIAGFGLSRESNRATARTLRSARLISAGAYTSANSVVVAVDSEGLGVAPGAGACKGDSGGPILRGGSGSSDLVGIISWSSGPQNQPVRRVCGGFTAMTPLAENSAWIAATMASLGRSEAHGGVVAPAQRQRRERDRVRPGPTGQSAPLMQERSSGAN
jgi:secreted trypsin-like serine protease